MFVLTVVLTVLLLAVVAAVAFAFFIIVRDNKQLKKDNSDLADKLDSTLSRQYSVGVSYKTKNKDVQIIMQHLSDVVGDLQKKACPSIRTAVIANNKEFLKSISQDISSNKSVKCSDIKKKYDEQTTKYGKGMAKDLASYLPPEKEENSQKIFKALSEDILVAVCTNDAIDVAKAEKLFTDVIDAICVPS